MIWLNQAITWSLWPILQPSFIQVTSLPRLTGLRWSIWAMLLLKNLTLTSFVKLSLDATNAQLLILTTGMFNTIPTHNDPIATQDNPITNVDHQATIAHL